MLDTRLSISALFFAATFVLNDASKFKIVNITQGPVKGMKSPDGNFFVFYGIPYATAPTGPIKFRAPLPAPTWTETFEAVNNNIFCPQPISPKYPKEVIESMKMQEDCLVANVYVPDIEEINLPVLVYIHGGAYHVGQGNLLTSQAMVNEGHYIVVNFNYRLGVFGFLCLGTEDIPGNAGMKDQVALLRWVKRNIASFGGNPNDVTISGSSSGSSSVELLMLSDMTKNLFHKVIPESGSGLSVWSVQIDPIETAKAYSRRFNVSSDDIRDLEKFYKDTSIEKFTAEPGYLKFKDSTFGFVPCVERVTGTDQFLKEAPIDIIKRGKFPKFPILIGLTNMEGLFRAPMYSDWKDEMNKNFSAFLPADMEFVNDTEREEVSKLIKQFYFDDKPIGNQTISDYVYYFTDVMFAYSMLRSVKLQLEAGNENIFLYEYSYVYDQLSPPPSPFNLLYGTGHSAETFALLEARRLGIDDSRDSVNSRRVKSLLRKLWMNFIKTGKPIPKATIAFPKGWPAVSSAGSPYMALDIVSELKGNELLAARFNFWDNLYKKYYRTPVPPDGA